VALFFEPDNKLSNKMWVDDNSDRPIVDRRSRSAKKVMYALFFCHHSDGIMARVDVPGRVTGKFCSYHVLTAEVNHYIFRNALDQITQ
jgi:hypothetical protein